MEYTHHKLDHKLGALSEPIACPASAIGIALYVGFIAPHLRPIAAEREEDL